MPWWGWLLLVLASLYPLHRLGIWMESKDWIYYRRKRKSGAAHFEAAGIFDPGMRHMQEAKREIVMEKPDGDDDDDRAPEDRLGPAR